MKTKMCPNCKGRKVIYNINTHDDYPCLMCKGTGVAGQSAGQPAPIPNNEPALWPKVIKDMEARDKFGRNKYGTPLQPLNGRDPLQDAYEEVLDMSVYMKQAKEEMLFLGNDIREILRQAKERNDKDLISSLTQILGTYQFLTKKS